ALAGFGRIFEARILGQPQRVAHKRRLLADFRSERAEGGDDLPGDALVSAENLGGNPALAPIETALADKPERVGEIVERGTQFANGEQKLVGRQPALAGLDGRDRLAILEAEQAREIV